MPGNPWPRDMIISVEDSATSLTFLLFIRAAWKLDHHGVPPLEYQPNVGTSCRPQDIDQDVANSRWKAEWQRAWSRFEPPDRRVHAPDSATQALLDTATDEELWETLSRRPSTFWDVGIDRAAFASWQEGLRDNHAVPLDEFPERWALPALVAAWRTGLTTIIQLPYAGYFAERINKQHLVVSSVVRHDAELYRRALGASASGG
jgi:hypothetical protein